jgi:CheY-like chemotaxis protein
MSSRRSAQHGQSERTQGRILCVEACEVASKQDVHVDACEQASTFSAAQVLERNGYVVDAACGPEAALELMREKRFDAVLAQLAISAPAPG